MSREPDFQDAEFMTAAEKRHVLRAWKRFLRSGLAWQQFTKALYQHLIMHCSFIAHYSREGFYRTYFTTGDGRIRFLSQFVTGTSTEYGSRWWLDGDYADINPALCEVAKEFAPGLLEEARALQRSMDLAEAERLARRHGATVSVAQEEA